LSIHTANCERYASYNKNDVADLCLHECVSVRLLTTSTHSSHPQTTDVRQDFALQSLQRLTLLMTSLKLGYRWATSGARTTYLARCGLLMPLPISKESTRNGQRSQTACGTAVLLCVSILPAVSWQRPCFLHLLLESASGAVCVILHGQCSTVNHTNGQSIRPCW